MNNLDERARRWLRVRICILGVLVLSGAVAVVARAFDLQFRQRSELTKMAEHQHLREIKVSPKRGTIYDRNGSELAVSVEVDSVFANPKRFKKNGIDLRKLSKDLASIFGLDPNRLAKKLANDRYFVWIKRQVTPQQAERVNALNIAGLSLTKEAKRYYPNRGLAAHLLGFANVDGRGIEGLELAFEKHLRGSDRRVPALRDRRGKVVFSEELLDREASLGHNLVLSIDKTIQYVAERELQLVVKTFEARAGSIVVMDPHSGDVLAVANYPTFNPNDPGRYKATDRRNRAVTDRFEPGSTVKPFAVASALSAGALGPYQVIDCEMGVMRIGNAKIHDSHPYDKLTPAEILQHSSNIGMAKIATALGRERLYRGLRAFGFGEKTGVLAPGETSGILRHYRSWYEMDTVTAAFGQGMSSTAMQLVTAMSAIANGGKLVRPILVKRITDGQGRILEEEQTEVRRRVVPRKVARLVADMLTSVTEEGGTATQAAIDGYLVSGKTGTAQKADYVSGGYADGKWVSSFAGFVPTDDPKLVVSVVIDEPAIAHYGGTVAAPAFRRVAEASLKHLGVPSRMKSVDDVAHAGDSRAAHVKPAIKATPKTLPDVSAQGPLYEVPNLVGKPMRVALVSIQERSLVPAVRGSGLVAKQIPVAGTRVAPGSTVELYFERRHWEGQDLDLENAHYDEAMAKR